ncbi:hypothetical protein [Planctomicrobium sp. SH664]|uniref:hypothetical protein n=1 Tax=Planctomicrobium sp. SH664 TaxID=3448125 RepID=UPI003F5BAE17
MRFATVSRIAVCLVSLTGLLTGTLTAADHVSADRRLPANTVLYFSCQDVPVSIKQFHETTFGKLLADPGFDKFKEDFKARAEEQAGEIEEKLGVTVEDLQALFAGEATFALIRPSNEPLAGALFVEIGDNEDVLAKLLTNLEKNIPNRNIEKETQTLQGVEVTILTNSAQNSGDQQRIAFFTKDKTFVASSSLSVLRGIITRWTGDQQKSLADSPNYKEIMTKCRTSARTNAVFSWYTDPVSLAVAAMSMDPNLQMPATILSQNLDKVGLDRLKAIGGVTEFNTPQYDTVNRTMIATTKPVQGLLKVFQLRTVNPTPPQWVPDEAAQFLTLDWDAASAFEAIGSMWNAIRGNSGEFEMFSKSVLQLPDGTPVDIKADIIDTLTGTAQGYVVAGDPGDELKSYGVLAIGLTNAEKGEKFLKALLAMKGEYKTETAANATLYLPVNEEQPWATAIQGQTLFLAQDVDMLKEALTGHAKSPLAGAEDFQRFAKLLPGNVSLLTYQNAFEQLQTYYDALREGEYDSFVEGKFDFSVLPDFKDLEKYFGPAGSYIVPDENGVLHVSFGLKPAE